MKRNGFTIVELIFVIIIIFMLIAAMCPVFENSRGMAKRTGCANNLRQMGQVLHLYAQDNDGRLPRRDNDFLEPTVYRNDRDLLICPSDRQSQRWDSSRCYYDERSREFLPYSSYVYRGGLSNEDPADIAVMSEARPWHGAMVNVLNVGGSVKTIYSDGFRPVVTPPMLMIGRSKPLHDPDEESNGTTPSPPAAPPPAPPTAPPPGR